MSRKPAVAPAVEPLFHPFDTDVPDAATCLDRVYDAFAYETVSYGWCRQCFNLDEETRMRSARDVRKAAPAVFSMIYDENPNCSGGASTFLHWLPRGLETRFFDPQLDPDLMEQMVRLGLWRWPVDRLAALRALFVRAAVDWFDAGHVAPLRLPDDMPLATPRARLNVSYRLVQALLTLRVDPAGVFRWLIEVDTPVSWDCLLDMVQEKALLRAPSYYVLDDDALKPVMAAGLAAWDRLCRHALHAVLTPDRLVERWMTVQASAPASAEDIAEAELVAAAVACRLTDAEQAADEAAVRTALAAVPSTAASAPGR